MKRFASLATSAALAGTLIGIGSSAHAVNTYNMWLTPISDLSKSYKAGDTIQFNALIEVLTGNSPITLTLGATIGYDTAKFDINGVGFSPDTSAYPPKPSVKLWDLVPPTAYSTTTDGTPTFQGGVGHTKQTTQPGPKTTTVPVGIYTIGTFSFPIIAGVTNGATDLILPTAFGKTGTNSAVDFINTIDSGGTNTSILAFPNDPTAGKFNKLTVNVGTGSTVPAPSSLLVVAMGVVPAVGVLRRRRSVKK